MTSGSTTERLVWDLPLRVYHWLLAASLLASWITAEIGFDARQVHMWLGFWMIGLVSFRLVWGFVGPRHSRFASFLPRPAAVVRHARETLTGDAPETAGHNPLGSLMVFAMLALLATQAVSGLFMDDDIDHYGPYAGAVSENVRDVMSSIHHNVVYALLALAALHVLAVAYLSFVRKHELIRPMVTGRKSSAVVAENDQIRSSRTWLALVVVAAIAAAILALGWLG